MWEHISSIVVAAGFVLHLGATIIGGTWALSQLKASLIAALAQQQKETDDEFEKMRREFGEVTIAIRQKINEVELWVRDNCVKREGFYKVRDTLAESIKELGREMVQRLDKLEKKIDGK